ncbi:MAG: hypothetical protein UV55_C0042G0001, partial [Candidatus Gottesmanbacteria bacterium GW2011_GWC1_43_10]
ISATATYIRNQGMGAGEIAYWDNLTLKPLTLSSLFSSVSTSDKDVVASADVTMTAGTQAGVVTNLDSASSPANFLIAYHDGTRVKLDKNVAGTYTNLISAIATYSAGATLRVITYHSDASTLKVRVYYNNALVGTEQTVTDAGIISNTLHGLFSTYSGNTFDNFTLFARGSDGEYAGIPAEPSDLLTATENTTTAYVKFGAKSAGLVNSSASYPFQYVASVNAGNTNTHTLSAYVYDGTSGNVGGKVTSAVAKLVFNGSVVTPTSYSNAGGGWWRVTYTAAGSASAANYGIEVQVGKTIYLDGVQLEEQGSATGYTDGSLGTGYAWSGTTNDSTSTRTAGGRGQNPTSVYHFDEGYGTTASDSSPNLNHLTLSGATWVSNYLNFDGSDDSLSRSFDQDFDFGTGSFTLAGSFKHPSTVSGTDTIIARYGSAGFKVYMNSSGYLCFAIDDDSSWGPEDSACSTVSYADSKWHSFSAVKNGTTSITLYVDGVQVGQDTSLTSTGSLSSSSTLYVGADSDGASNYWAGYLDEMAVYPYDRSSDQVKIDNLGQQVSVILGARENDNLTDGLVGWWKLDESAGGTAVDSSSNSNSGTYTNGATNAAGKFANGGVSILQTPTILLMPHKVPFLYG